MKILCIYLYILFLYWLLCTFYVRLQHDICLFIPLQNVQFFPGYSGDADIDTCIRIYLWEITKVCVFPLHDQVSLIFNVRHIGREGIKVFWTQKSVNNQPVMNKVNKRRHLFKLSTTSQSCLSQQARGFGPMLGRGLSFVYDADPTSAQHWAKVACLPGSALGGTTTYKNNCYFMDLCERATNLWTRYCSWRTRHH